MMRQLARTLLILGSVTACERAHPVVHHQERPAVGNIGQTGRPAAAAAIAQPLVDASGAPAVGNIGQTGAPVVKKPKRRVQRVQRAIERPLVTREDRPATGNVMMKGKPRPNELAIVDSTGAAEVAAKSPLVDRRERPMVGNLGRSGRLRPTRKNLAALEAAIVETREVLAAEPESIEAQQQLAALLLDHHELARELNP